MEYSTIIVIAISGGVIFFMLLWLMLLSTKYIKNRLELQKLENTNNRLEESLDNLTKLPNHIQELTKTATQSSERLSILLQSADSYTKDIASLKTTTTTLNESTNALGAGLNDARRDIRAIATTNNENNEKHKQVLEILNRLQMLMVGSKTKGQVGENILNEIFSVFPDDWYIKDFTIDGKIVEYAFKLPNNLLLPVDSKWPSNNLIEQLESDPVPENRKKLVTQITNEVAKHAEDVKKYISVNRTTNYAIMVVPEPVLDSTKLLLAKSFSQGIIITSYTFLMHHLLLAYQAALNNSSTDLAAINNYLDTIETQIDVALNTLRSNLSKTITMLINIRNSLDTGLDKAKNSINSIKTNQNYLPLTQTEQKDSEQYVPPFDN